MATYGDFPGVRVETQQGAISTVAVGSEETLIIFGEASYNSSNEVEGDDTSLSISANEPEQIRAPRVADNKFGGDSELAAAMKEALANGANLDYLYGVAVPRVGVTAESSSTQEGVLDNVEIVEDADTITFDDDGTSLDVEFRYDGAPEIPTSTDTVFINPLTGEYAADSAPATDFSVDYDYNDYSSAFNASAPKNVVNEGETGIMLALSESDSVSSSLNTVVESMRENYQLVNGLSFAEPNDNELTESGADARYDPVNYGSANQSVTSEAYYKFAPAREENELKTIGGGIGGLFAGNPIDDPIYNEALTGYSSLEQKFTKTDASNMRDNDVIPIRSGGAVRVKGNRSTAFSETDTVAADFWSRRVTDRVILIGKLIGDRILGRINDEGTRDVAERLIESQLRQLSTDSLIRQNTPEETNWRVDVYEDSNNPNEVNIDISFSPYGIVKNVDETITVDTN